MLGQFNAVLEQCQKALSIWESIENKAGVSWALNGIGVAYHRLGEYQAALDTLYLAVRTAQETGAIRAAAYSLTSLGDLYRDLAQFEETLACYDRALEQNLVIDTAYLRSYVINARAETLCLTGQAERATGYSQHRL